MPITHAVALVDKVQMRINVNDVDQPLIIKSFNARNMHRVIATKCHRHHTRFENLSNGKFDIFMRFNCIRVDHVSIADINNLDPVLRQVRHVIFEIVHTPMAK